MTSEETVGADLEDELERRRESVDLLEGKGDADVTKVCNYKEGFNKKESYEILCFI